MERSKLFKSIANLLAGGLFIFLIFFISLAGFGRQTFLQGVRLYVFSRLADISLFISELRNIRNMTGENIALKEENTKLLARIAQQAVLNSENEFLRATLNLGLRKSYKLTDAMTFNLQFTPTGHYLLVNKGINDGIKNSDLVISPSGILIGKITKTDIFFSRVELITNPDFKVTVKLLDHNTTGMATGVFDEGVSLDLISQNDTININDAVVTNGNDIFPSGLIVGHVSYIGPNNGNLFKKVLVKPEFRSTNISRVLILNI